MQPGDETGAYNVVCSSLDQYYESSVLDFFLLQWPHGQLVAVDFTNRVVGYLAGSILQNGNASISLFCVMPGYRKKGIGSALLERFKLSARMCGIRTIQLEVRENNAAGKEFYRRRGFMETERLAGFYNDGGTAIRMVCPSAPDFS